MSAASFSSSASLLEAELRSGIESSLRLQLEENAIFLAERLFAEFPSQSSLLKVADCYRASGDVNTALRLLRHYSPFTQLVSETSSSSSSSSSSSPSLLNHNQHQNSDSNNRPWQLTPRWRLNYLYGVLAAKVHQYSEAERVLSNLIGGDMCPECKSGIVIASQQSNNKNSSSSSSSSSDVDAATIAVQLGKQVQEDEAAVRYWLGICGCHQGEAAKAKPGTYFGQAASACPTFFCAFKEAVTRCDAMQADNHPYSPHIVDFLNNQQQEQQQQQGNNNNNNGFAKAISAVCESRKIISKFLFPFAEVVRLLFGTYDCSSALSIVSFGQQSKQNNNNNNNNNSIVTLPQLSSAQRFSGWSLEQAALSYFHSGRTQDAIATYEQLRQREPWRVNTPSMVYFSTCLWHSRQEVALCALAQKMIETIPRSPYTLCVVGNCHSLNRDSRAAATMFSRAASVDPAFAYAHTLRGHELLALEDVGEAETAFYEALKWDHRHYPAFAGLGELYFRTEKEGPAREQFRYALRINATLPAVLCRLAATYHRAGASRSDLETALQFYESSLERCPSHLPSQQQKATILVRLGRLEEAQVLLSALLEASPEEPSLHVAYGKCVAKMGNQDAAIRSFHRAMDLDPRRQASIKVLLDRVAAKKDVDGGF